MPAASSWTSPSRIWTTESASWRSGSHARGRMSWRPSPTWWPDIAPSPHSPPSRAARLPPSPRRFRPFLRSRLPRRRGPWLDLLSAYDVLHPERSAVELTPEAHSRLERFPARRVGSLGRLGHAFVGLQDAPLGLLAQALVERWERHAP